MTKQSVFKVLVFFALILIFLKLTFSHEDELILKEMIPSPSETHHLEVKPETVEGYRLPYMKVTVEIIDKETNENKNMELHPMFGGNFHYGVNVVLQPKQYLLRFHLDAPTFARTHARENQWIQPIEAEFTFDASAKFEKNIKIGSKETRDMKVSFEAEHAESMFILEGTEQEHSAMGHQSGTQFTKNSSTPLFYAIFLIVGAVLGIGIYKFMRKRK